MRQIPSVTRGFAAGLAVAMSIAVIAAPLSVPHSFTAGTPARAAEVNSNFTAVATAVNDNDTRIGALETASRLPNLAPTGNLVLADSSAVSGSVLKGSASFLHDFGSMNTFVGRDAGNFTLTGTANTAVGANVLKANENGGGNSALGRDALSSNASGFFNVAVGSEALMLNSSGSRNIAVGSRSLGSNVSGGQNIAIGVNAMPQFVAGVDNIGMGIIALSGLVSGSNNIAIGSNAGGHVASGSNNIWIGNLGFRGDEATLRLGQQHTRAFIAGIRGVTTASMDAVPVFIDSNGQLGTINSSGRFKDDIADMGDASRLLMRLRPVTFFYKSDRNPAGRARQYGLIAEEVARVAPDLVAHSRDGQVETVFYEFVTPMLLNEFQKQQRTIDAQKARLAQFERELAALRQETSRVVAMLAHPVEDRN